MLVHPAPAVVPLERTAEPAVASAPVAIFGATGYVGLVLARRLRAEHQPLVLFLRNPRRLDLVPELGLEPRVDLPLREECRDGLVAALRGVDTIYYLIHSMLVGLARFERTDQHLAELVGSLAAEAGVRQIVFLGGLGQPAPGHPLSPHLRSRQQIGACLGRHGVPVCEIRTSIIVGNGSASFEIIRALGTKLPFIPALAFNTGACEPVFIDDVIHVLLRARSDPACRGQVLEVGCGEQLGYADLVTEFARVAKGRRLRVVRLPLLGRLLTPHVVSRIITALTHLPLPLTRALVVGMGSRAVSTTRDLPLLGQDPGWHPVRYREALLKTVGHLERERAVDIWTLPGQAQWQRAIDQARPGRLRRQQLQGVYVHELLCPLAVDEIEPLFAELLRLGGDYGYWSPHWLWSLRGALDRVAGGLGLGRRRLPGSMLHEGLEFDCWRVERLVDRPGDKELRLRFTMRAPGTSWAHYRLEVVDEKRAVFTFRTLFDPAGPAGTLYWRLLEPVHQYVFETMFARLLRQAHRPAH